MKIRTGCGTYTIAFKVQGQPVQINTKHEAYRHNYDSLHFNLDGKSFNIEDTVAVNDIDYRSMYESSIILAGGTLLIAYLICLMFAFPVTYGIYVGGLTFCYRLLYLNRLRNVDQIKVNTYNNSHYKEKR